MSRLLRLSLILLLVVTATALGHARGQSRIAGQVVLCGGGMVTVAAADHEGRPVPVPHLCPDMALSLLAGLSPEPPMAAPPRSGRVARWMPQAVAAGGAGILPAQARGPPSGA